VAFGRAALWLVVARRGCHLPSDTAPITDAGLQQLGNRSLIGLEQFIRPLQTLKPFAQRLDLMSMRLDFLLDHGDLVARMECIYRYAAQLRLVQLTDGAHAVGLLRRNVVPQSPADPH